MTGPLVASGRDADIFAIGDGRVLRRPRHPATVPTEADVMCYLGAQGFPVPAVVEVRPDGVVMERIDGPSMLDELGSDPPRVRRHARTLADLHRRLHQIAPPPGLGGAGDVVVHGDLHPGNVLLAARGPVVIDWTTARRGPAGVDLAEVWLLVACAEVPASDVLRGEFLTAFLSREVRELARPHLADVAGQRQHDANLSTTEKQAMLRLAAANV